MDGRNPKQFRSILTKNDGSTAQLSRRSYRQEALNSFLSLEDIHGDANQVVPSIRVCLGGDIHLPPVF